MRILLVRPRRRKQAITLGEIMFSEPIGLECVYSILKDKHDVRILDLMAGDEVFKDEFLSYNPDVVGITSLCIDVFAVLELAKEAKTLKPGVITMVGGTQAFLNPDSFFNHAIDHVFKYTTVQNLRALFDIIQSKNPVPMIDGIHSKENDFKATGVECINDYITPDRTSTEKYRHQYSYFGYRPCAIMQTSRGCSGGCNFCLRWKIEGHKEQDEDIDCVIKQIQDIKEDSIMIYDNDFLYNGPRLEKICHELESNNIKKNLICYGSIKSIIRNKEVIKRLGSLGLRAVLVGYESFSDKELDDYNKKTSAKENLETSKILREADIDCWASFILHPDWDIKDFKNFRRHLIELRPQVASLVPLTPFPKSYLYTKYKDRLIFDDKDYDKWSFSLVAIKPTKMGLRRYYYEVLKSNFYVNFYNNNAVYMIKKFGFATVFRIMRGSILFLKTYVKLMLRG